MTQQEQNMYGMSETDINEQFKWMINAMGARMTAISLLSDVQEIMEQDSERARKWINIAKKILVDEMQKEQKEVA